MAIGVVMIASASAGIDRSPFDGAIWKSLYGRQMILAGVGFVVMLAVGHIGGDWFRWSAGLLQPSMLIIFLAILLLSATLWTPLGMELNGARRWMLLGPPGMGFHIQSSEAAKVGVILFLAAYGSSINSITGEPGFRHFWRGFFPVCLLLGVCIALVGVEDFGTAGLLAAAAGGMMLVAGAKLLHLFIALLPGIAGFLYLLFAEPYRLARLTGFRDYWNQADGLGYHPIQSLATIVSGGLTGRGLGYGIQKYGYLPQSRSDFIFAVICEETGLIGAAVVLGLFGVLIGFGIRAVRRSDDEYVRLLAFGITLMIALQAIINVAVVTVMVPTKGIALPFVSAGGSGLVVLCAMTGLLAWCVRKAG
jgi:cell division protein FtsW